MDYQYLNTDQAAELLCVSRGTLANMRVQGKGPKFIKFGGKILYSQNDIDEYVAQNTYSSTAQIQLRKSQHAEKN